MDIIVNNIRLNMLRSGSGEPIILLHGNTESKDIFDQLVEELESHFDVIRYDTRCHGKSACAGPLSYPLLAEDLICLIKELGLVKPYVFGFSDGAITIMESLVRDQSLFGMVALAGLNTSPRGLKKHVLRGIKRSFREKGSPLDNLMLSQKALSRHFLESINVSLLLIFGEHDVIRKHHVQMLKKTLKPHEVIVLEGHTHDSYVIDCPLLAPILIDFHQKRMSHDILESTE